MPHRSLTDFPPCFVFHAYVVILGLSLTGAVTQIVKITVGRPRPGQYSQHYKNVVTSYHTRLFVDVISRCIPPPGTVDPEFGLTTAAVCTTTDFDRLRDGFRSFPSGHSSRKLSLRISGTSTESL